MSFTDDGRRVLCDGVDCGASSAVPVALRRVLAPDRLSLEAPADDWLFVRQSEGCSHFCPNCRKSYLDSLRQAG